VGQSKRRQGLRSKLLRPHNQHLQRGGKQPYIIVKGRKDNVKRSNDKASDQSGRDLLESRGGADLSFPTSKTRRGRVQGDGDLSPTILAGANEICFLGVNDVDEDKEEIRRITPREAWRLMDFSDEDYDKAAAINSQTALYAQAGNAIVRQVLIDIFGQMIDPKPIENEQLSIF